MRYVAWNATAIDDCCEKFIKKIVDVQMKW